MAIARGPITIKYRMRTKTAQKPVLPTIHIMLIYITFFLYTFLCTVSWAETIDQNKKDLDQTDSDQIDFDSIKGLEDELHLLIDRRQYVSIASKVKEDVAKAPSIVTVITDEEMENMGARTISDVLRIVPGFDIIKSALVGTSATTVRGIGTAGTSSRVKVLLDGHSTNDSATGDATLFFDDLPLKNVKRIEIIRGPGSAIYGANAFLAVINVITKNAEDIDGIELSTGFGSYDTQDYSIMFGKKLYGIDIAGFANFYNTNGLSETIKEDALSSQLFFKRFSIAPANSNDSRNQLDLVLKLSYKNIELKAKYMNRDFEPFVGLSFVLNNDSEQFLNYVMADLSYEFDIGERLTIQPRIYYDQYDTDSLIEIFPDGYTVPFDLDGNGNIERFPDGVFSQAITTSRKVGAEIQMVYDLSEDNSFSLGFVYEWERLDNVQFKTNFDPLTGASLGSIQNVTNTASFIRETVRQIWSIYIQDKWDIGDDLRLTMGVRHDHYSDFEGTTNPRIGIAWNFMDNATLKLLYGQAFRPPNFQEQYLQNNPIGIGNPDLDPETIRTYEVELGYKFTSILSSNVNYFYNVIRDTIGARQKNRRNSAYFFDNIEGSNVQGIEFEVKADLGDLWDGVYAFVNYTYQDAESKGDPLPDVPKHKGNIGINVKPCKYLNVNLDAFISGKRVRIEEDTRDDSPGYALLNLTLNTKEFFKGFNVKASLFNILDKDYNDPAPVNTIATDLPRPGRTFFLELGYDF